jgi:hypothetical protein
VFLRAVWSARWLLNIALRGMEKAAGIRYDANGWARADPPVLVRYADDWVALCRTRQKAPEVKARLALWLAPSGTGSQRGQDARRLPRRGL